MAYNNDMFDEFDDYLASYGFDDDTSFSDDDEIWSDMAYDFEEEEEEEEEE
jgi:CRISPR/Cas system-associated endonuclease/helicase Cas3